jgi:YVTN family beta-propeller protein
VEFRILGSIEARDGDRVLCSGSGKPTALLAILLLHANEVVPTDKLIDELWQEQPPRTAAKSLQTYVSQLRRALGNDAIVTRPSGYVLPVARDELDADRFEEVAVEGRAALEAGDAAAAAAALRQALELWRGPPLAEVAYESWARPHVERLEEARLQALEARLDADLVLGRHADVVGELEGLTRDHPLRERLLALLMLAQYRCGRQADALESYRRGRRRLLEELGIEPTPELRALEQQILRQNSDLDGPATRRAHISVPTRRSRRLGLAAIVALAAAMVVWIASGGGSGASVLAPANSVVLVGPTGHISQTIEVGAAPAHAVAGGGFVWTSNESDGTVSRVDERQPSVETIPVGRSPEGLAYAAGDVWVADGGDGTLAAIDPRAGKVVRTVRVGGGPLGVAARGSRIWVANSVDGTLSTVDAESGSVVRTVAVGGEPTAVVATPGAVWVAVAASDAVVELDRDGRSVVTTVNVGNDPSALATAHGSVWVANSQDDTVSRIDPLRAVVDETVPLGGSPVALAAGSGIVWTSLADGRLVQLDAGSGRVLRRSVVGGEPAAVVPDGRDAWVATLSARSRHRGGTLRVETGPVSECGCLDPLAVVTASGLQLDDLVYDGLVAYRRVGGPAGAMLVGDLAEAVPRPTDAGRTYVFRLRPGVRFSDGHLVNPSDVRSSFVRAFKVNRETVFPLYSTIAGAGSCGSGGRCDLSHGIVADDSAHTVTFHLTAPDPNLLYTLALPWAFVVPRHSPLTIARRPLAGTGPYRIASYQPPSPDKAVHGHAGQLVLVRNRRFRVFAPDATPDGYPNRIAVTVGVPAVQQVGAVTLGAADAATSLFDLPPRLLARLGTRFASQLRADSLGETEYEFLNTRVPPFDRLDARRALNEAVDRAHLVRLLGGPGAASATCEILPPGFPGYRPYCPYGRTPSPAGTWTGPDVARARRLVAASGTRGERVRVWAPTDHRGVASYVARVLRRLGYRASTEIVRGEPTKYYAEVGNAKTKAQIGWSGWIKDYAAPADFIRPLFSCAGILPRDPVDTTNYSRFCSRALDRRIEAAGRLQQRDPVAGNHAWAAIDRTLVNRAAAVPYANILTLTVLSRRTGNYEFNPQWGVLLDQLWVK